MLGDGSKSSKDLVASVEKNGGGNYVDAVDENGRFIVLKSERNASLRVEKGDFVSIADQAGLAFAQIVRFAFTDTQGTDKLGSHRAIVKWFCCKREIKAAAKNTNPELCDDYCLNHEQELAYSNLPEEEIDARTIIYTIKLLPYWRFNGYDAPVGTDEQGIPRFNTYYVTLFAKYDKGQNLRARAAFSSSYVHELAANIAIDNKRRAFLADFAPPSICVSSKPLIQFTNLLKRGKWPRKDSYAIPRVEPKASPAPLCLSIDELREEEAENNVTLTGNFLCSNGDLLCHMLGRLRFTPNPAQGIITVCVNPKTEMLKKQRAALEQSLIEHLVNHDLLSGHPDIYVARIQDPAHPAYGKAGRDRGVFAAAALPENTVLGVYVGCLEVFSILNTNDDGEYAHDLPRHELDGQFDQDVWIQAREIRNVMAYINDYVGVPNESGCNATAVNMLYNRFPVIAIATTRNVAAGEELLLDYGPYYQGHRGKGAAPSPAAGGAKEPNRRHTLDAVPAPRPQGEPQPLARRHSTGASNEREPPAAKRKPNNQGNSSVPATKKTKTSTGVFRVTSVTSGAADAATKGPRVAAGASATGHVASGAKGVESMPHAGRGSGSAIDKGGSKADARTAAGAGDGAEEGRGRLAAGGNEEQRDGAAANDDGDRDDATAAAIRQQWRDVESFESAVAAMKASVPIISVIPSAIREARAELEASEARAETLSGELQAAKSRASSLEDKLKNAEEKLKNAEKKRNKAEEKLLESDVQTARLQSKLTAIGDAHVKEMKAKDDEIERLNTALEARSQKIKQLERLISVKDDRIKEVETKFQGLFSTLEGTFKEYQM